MPSISSNSSSPNSSIVEKGGQTMLSSAAAVFENGKRGLLRKFGKVPGYFGFGGLRVINGGGRKPKRQRKLARESRLSNFAREFRGSLMLEPLEERIVPAVGRGLVGAGGLARLNF